MTNTPDRPAPGRARHGRVVCPGCRARVDAQRWRDDLRVCPECGRHDRLPARERLDLLADPGSVRLLPPVTVREDVLEFTDTVPYPRRLAAARERTGLHDAVLCARIDVEGRPAVCAVMDFRFLGGSLGAAAGEAVVRAAETALAERAPLLLVTASGGLRMQEGPIALAQTARTSAAMGRLDEAGVLTVSLVTDPTYGGVAASFATLADVIVAEPGARLGLAGRRVVERAAARRLPEDFQTAGFLLARGLVDMVVPRRALRRELGRLLALNPPGPAPVPAPGPAGVPASERGPGREGDRDGLLRDPDALPPLDPWEQVLAARSADRPGVPDYLALAFDDFQELRGDRAGGDCPAVLAGTARLAGRPVAVIGHRGRGAGAGPGAPGHATPSPAGHRKAARVMRLAAKLGLPVVTLVDTPGDHPGPQAEEHGQAGAIAENLRLMAALPVPVVTAVVGQGGGAAALGIAVADRTLALSGAVYSVISPEDCAAILWHDPAAAPRAAAVLGLDAPSLLRLGVVDGVVPEPEGGAAADPALTADRLRAALTAALAELAGLSGDDLVSRRRARLRHFGTPVPPPRPPGLPADPAHGHVSVSQVARDPGGQPWTTVPPTDPTGRDERPR
ncbi:carboxyl transferase domain-containing protein [Allostreptomyces psammosilenae]|uniref:Acetyl-coenzyme A carboxylase carboxyl transferase subunit beta n=1 Tax=Allostreptomyces psammosilenae TaxID=1892865 RepID=A0A853A110_9ACTN|nr:carboxyl transferase domain-containing protein [Allostreptomyces psammosilenae]NYI04192.1 acetyl-CoA carboxylase carboxyl transferase subunit beta [Allostreptomyces psammosilenae]